MNDGVYKTTVGLPRYSAPGLWVADEFDASDKAGNQMWLSTSKMTSAGFPSAFTQTGAGDVTRPVLKGFSFEPTTIDTTNGYDTVVFTMRISDDITGVGSPEQPGWLTVTGPTLTHVVGFSFSAMDRVAGDAFEGTYKVSAPIMQFTETGVWTVGSVAFADNLGNWTTYLTADLVSAGFPTQFTSLEAETNAPILADFSLAPSKVDTSKGPRTITLKARIIDDAAGLGGEPGQSGITIATQVSFMSPSTNASVDADFSYQDRVSGDALDGVYEVQLTVPKGSEQGTWTVTDFTLVDAYGNMRTLDASDLVSSGFASSFTVTEPGGAPPPIGPTPTVGLVDPGSGLWYLRDDKGVVTSFYFGNPGDFPFVGDWDCDGVDTPGMYRQSDGFVYLCNSNTQGIADVRFFFGNPRDVPLAGDFNGDGCDTVSIYRPSLGRFYIIDKLGANNGGLGAAETDYLFGNPGDKPFVGDFDGDGVDTVGLHRESTGLVYFRNTHTQGIADSQFI